MRKYTIVFVSLFVLALSGCDTRRELLEERGVDIQLDWNNLKAGDAPFDQMELHLYDERGNHIIKHTDRTGYTGTLPEGNYSLLVFNPNASNVLYEALDEYEHAEIRTSSASTRASADEELLHPSSIYGCSVDEFTVKTSVLTQVRASLRPYVSVLRVKIELTGAVSRVVGCKVKVSGIADRINHSTGEVLSTHDEFIVLSVDMVHTGFESTISILGVNGKVENIMEVLLTLDDGETLVAQENITEEIKSVNNPLSPNINITPKIDLDNRMGKLTATIISWEVSGGDINLDE